MKVADIVTELKALGKLKGGGETGRGDYGTVFRTPVLRLCTWRGAHAVQGQEQS